MRAGAALLAALVAVLPLACGPEPPAAPARPSTPALATGSFTAELDGFPIRYEVRGTGPVLMTLPNSWGLSLDGLRALYRPLEAQRTMVYFDPRGMGGSGAVREEAEMGLEAVRRDFDALRRHLGLDRVDVIGWSNGATNLIFLASERPEILRRAVFAHTVARVTPEDFAGFAERYPAWAAANGRLQQQLADDSLAEDEKTAILKRYSLEDAYPNLFADPAGGRETLGRVWAGVGFSHRHGLYAQQELSLYDLTDRLAGIPIPSLVLAGDHDLLPAERVEEMHAALPDSRFHLFADSGHFSPLEQPEEFVAVVLGFLDGTASRAATAG